MCANHYIPSVIQRKIMTNDDHKTMAETDFEPIIIPHKRAFTLGIKMTGKLILMRKPGNTS